MVACWACYITLKAFGLVHHAQDTKHHACVSVSLFLSTVVCAMPEAFSIKHRDTNFRGTCLNVQLNKTCLLELDTFFSTSTNFAQLVGGNLEKRNNLESKLLDFVVFAETRCAY